MLSDAERALLRQDELEMLDAIEDALNSPTTFRHSQEKLVSLVATVPQFLGRLAAARAGERWIPVTERLPEDDSRILAAVPFTNTSSGKVEVWVGECLFYEGGEGSGPCIFTDLEGNEYEAEGVDGWRPLPSPPAESETEQMKGVTV